MHKKIGVVFLSTAILLQSVCGLWAQTSDAQDLFITLTRTPVQQKYLPSSVNVISEKEIKKSGAQNVGEILENQVGVFVNKANGLGSSHQVAIRGFNSSRILVLIDNQPVRNLYTGTIDLSQISLSNVERIEIVRGASSALYGANAQGGVIHIITKSPKMAPTLTFDTQLRSYQTALNTANLGFKQKQFDFFTSVSKDVSGGFRKNSDWDHSALSAKLGYDFMQWGRSEFYIAHEQSRLGLPGVAADPDSGKIVPIKDFDGQAERVAYTPRNRQNDNQTDMRYNHRYVYEDLFAATVRLYQERKNQVALSYFGSSAFESTTDAVAQGLETQLEFLRLGLTVGSQAEQDQFRSQDSAEITSSLSGFYIQENIVLLNHLSVLAGLRSDHHSDYGDSLNPRFGAVYTINDQWSVSGNIGRSFRAPTFADRFNSFAPNPNIKPERTWQGDAGVSCKLTEDSNVKATYFRSQTQDKIILVPNDDYRAKNFSKAYSQGAELEYSQQILENLSHSLNYTFMETKGKNDDQSEYNYLPYNPKHHVNYQLFWKALAGIEVTNSLEYVDVQYYPDSTGKNLTILDPYILWGIKISKRFAQCKLYFGVDNLTNTRYASQANAPDGFPSGGYFPQPGRTFWGGFTLYLL